MEKARKRIPMWLRYIINAVLVAVLLIGGTLLYNSGLLNRDSKAVVIQ